MFIFLRFDKGLWSVPHEATPQSVTRSADSEISIKPPHHHTTQRFTAAQTPSADPDQTHNTTLLFDRSVPEDMMLLTLLFISTGNICFGFSELHIIVCVSSL